MTNSAWKTPHFPFPAPSVTRNSRPKLVNVRQHLSDCWPVFLIEGSLLSISVFVRKNNIRFLEEERFYEPFWELWKYRRELITTKTGTKPWNPFIKIIFAIPQKKEKRGSSRTRSRSRTWKISRKINYNKNWNKTLKILPFIKIIFPFARERKEVRKIFPYKRSRTSKNSKRINYKRNWNKTLKSPNVSHSKRWIYLAPETLFQYREVQ